MNVLIDCCLSDDWTGFLSASGHVPVLWRAVGSSSAPDVELFDWAAANGCIVLTHDLDFGALLASRRTSSPSVIQIRARSHLPEDVGESVLSAMKRFATELAEGAIVTVDTTRAKVRLLPLA